MCKINASQYYIKDGFEHWKKLHQFKIKWRILYIGEGNEVLKPNVNEKLFKETNYAIT